MKIHDIIDGRIIDSTKMHEILKAIDRHGDDNEDLKMEISFIVNDGHMCEYSAKAKIHEMEAVAYLGKDGRKLDAKSMEEYLSMIGVTPESSLSMVSKSHEEAKAKARGIGFSAPVLSANMWDCYWCLAMVLSDYWYTVCGDLETASMIAYEYLSDPDR